MKKVGGHGFSSNKFKNFYLRFTIKNSYYSKLHNITNKRTFIMTAEIAILNKSAVALAADSAGTTANKIYNTQNKLFNLNKYFPIGCMIYGNSHFVGIPWETIIKMYRAKYQLEEEKDTIEAVAEDFIQFVENQVNFNNYHNIDFLRERVRNLFTYILNSVTEEIGEETANGVIQTEQVIIEKYKRIVDLTTQNISGLGYLNRFDLSDENFILTNFESLFDELRTNIIPDFPKDIQTIKKLYKLVAVLFTHSWFNMSELTGIVFSGFGKKEFLPSNCSFEVDGIANGKLRVRNKKYESLEKMKGTYACLRPYADTDMIHSFMKGVHPYYEDILRSCFEGAINSYNNSLQNMPEISVLGANADDLIKRLKEFNKQIVLDTSKQLNEVIRFNYTEPILNTIGLLPKDELALMAESLVNITSLKKRFSVDAETVGGAIDVAVISKGDGFIWIKRKHYFDADLNPQFFKNYFK